MNVKLFTLLRCAHLFNVGFKITLFKLFIQSHFDYCSTVYSHLSTVSITRINRCFNRALYRLTRINIKDTNISSQLEILTPFKLLPLSLRLCYRFNTFLFTLCKRNQQSDIFKYINKQRNAKNNLILPKCRTDLLKYSFCTISIKLLKLYLLDNLFLEKHSFIFFLKREILDLYNITSIFFT